MLRSLYKWLASADSPGNADLIFVLAGLERRKSYALELFNAGLAPRILFSTGRFEVRRFVNLPLPQRLDLLKMVENIPPPMRHFFVCVTRNKFEVERISARGLGTLREIEALAQWLKTRQNLCSLMIVSSGAHLRRIRLCCRALLPKSLKLLFAAIPEEDQRLESLNWWAGKHTRKMVLAELLKILCYSLALPVLRISKNWRSKSPQASTS